MYQGTHEKALQEEVDSAVQKALDSLQNQNKNYFTVTQK